MSLKPYPDCADSGVDWLGKLPAAWPVVPAKAVFRERKSRSNAEDTHLTPSQTYGVLPQAEYMEISGNRVVLNLSGADNMRHVEAGDYVSHLRSFQGGLEYSPLRGKVSAAYTVLSPRGTVDSFYFKYLFKSARYVQALQTTTDQLRDGQSIRYEQFALLPLPLPSVDEQREIARFLDRETAEIDAFIADQEELIALLLERRDSVWQAKVDKLGPISVVVPVRRAIRTIADGPFGSSLTSAHYVESGARVVRLGNIGINAFKDRDKAFISLEYFEQLSAHEVCAGDVVVAGLGDDKMPLGRATVVPDLGGPAIVKADCYRVRPNELVSANYLAWILSSPQSRAQMKVLSRGSTRARLNTSVVREVLIPIPSRHDQDEFVERTSTVIREIDAADADAQEAIALSKERRAGLISAAVTGKIDVRNHGGVE